MKAVIRVVAGAVALAWWSPALAGECEDEQLRCLQANLDCIRAFRPEKDAAADWAVQCALRGRDCSDNTKQCEEASKTAWFNYYTCVASQSAELCQSLYLEE